MSVESYPLHTILLQDQNGNATYDRGETLSNSQGAPITESAPEVQEILQKLGKNSLEGVSFPVAQFFLTYVDAANATYEQGNFHLALKTLLVADSMNALHQQEFSFQNTGSLVNIVVSGGIEASKKEEGDDVLKGLSALLRSCQCPEADFLDAAGSEFKRAVALARSQVASREIEATASTGDVARTEALAAAIRHYETEVGRKVDPGRLEGLLAKARGIKKLHNGAGGSKKTEPLRPSTFTDRDMEDDSYPY